MMKKYLIALAMLLTLSTASPVAAQKHRHNPAITANVTKQNTVKADSATTLTPADKQSSTTSTGDDAIVAYSDTTSNDSSTTVANNGTVTYTIDGDDEEVLTFLERLLGMFGGAFGGFLAVLIALLVFLFLLAPFIALAVIVWLLMRNRNRKYKLAEKAMETGQQIPPELLREEPKEDSDLWRNGIKRAALGLGLVAFFYCLGADPLTGIGWLVTFYGIGQAIIGYRDRKRNDITDDQL